MRALGIAIVLASAGSAVAQIGGTVYVDFNGFNGTPQGNVSALTAGLLPGLNAAQLPGFKSMIVGMMQAEYQPYSINITDVLPAGNFTRVVIGDTGTSGTGALGIANEIDFRNKRESNLVSVLVSAHVAAPFFPSTMVNYARMLSSTASHELGHVLGLMHSDVVSTFKSGGSASVQANEIMTAVRTYNGTNEYLRKSFFEYSDTKLKIATQGINVELENGTTNFETPFVADPARAGATGATVAAATALNFDVNNNVTVLGNIAANTDCYKFTCPANTTFTAEVFSKALVAGTAPGSVGRITDPIDAILELVDNNNNLVQAMQWTSASDFDGNGNPDFGSDALIHKFTIAAGGTYGVRVRGGADASGDYELFVQVPGPGALGLGLCGLLAMARRRR